MEVVEVVQHVPSAGELIVVCQCHRSCRYVEVASLYGVLPQVQLLDKVADLPVASMTGAWGRQCRKLWHPQLPVLTLGSMSLLCRSSIGSLAGGASNSIHRQCSWIFQCAQRQGAFSRVWWRCWVGHFSRSSGSSRS